jgi:Zn-dependent protease
MQIGFVTGFFWFVAFLFSTTLHEAMHAFVAWRLGDSTAYHGGQVSLSPVPHVQREPIGMLVLPLLTSVTQGWAIGWASAPYDPVWAERYPTRAALMAAAGPCGNFLIALFSYVLMFVGLNAGVFAAPDRANFEAVVVGASGDPTFATTLLSVLLVQNVFLGCFNLLPLPPLDGSAVLPAVLPERHAFRLRELSANPMMSMVGLLIAWQVFPKVTNPLFSLMLRLVHPHELYS